MYLNGRPISAAAMAKLEQLKLEEKAEWLSGLDPKKAIAVGIDLTWMDNGTYNLHICAYAHPGKKHHE